MSITAIALTPVRVSAPGKSYWAVNAFSSDWSGAEVIKAAPSAASSLYVQSILAWSNDAVDITFKGTSTAFLGPVEFMRSVSAVGQAPGGKFDVRFGNPIEVGDGLGLVGTGSGAGQILVIVEGFTN